MNSLTDPWQHFPIWSDCLGTRSSPDPLRRKAVDVRIGLMHFRGVFCFTFLDSVAFVLVRGSEERWFRFNAPWRQSLMAKDWVYCSASRFLLREGVTGTNWRRYSIPTLLATKPHVAMCSPIISTLEMLRGIAVKKLYVFETVINFLRRAASKYTKYFYLTFPTRPIDVLRNVGSLFFPLKTSSRDGILQKISINIQGSNPRSNDDGVDPQRQSSFPHLSRKGRLLWMSLHLKNL